MTDDEYLAHIEKAILEIQSHTAGLTQEAYEADSKTQRAVESAMREGSARLRESDVRAIAEYLLSLN